MRLFLLVCFFFSSLAVTGYCQDPPPAKVRTAPITKEQVSRNKPFLGILYYDRLSKVSSEVAGLVETINVRSGDRVKKGEPLVQLNTDLLDQDIKLSTTRVKQKKLENELAQKNYDRQKSLLENRGASQKKYDDAQFAYNNSMMEQQAAQHTLARLRLQQKKSLITAPFDGIILEKNVDSGDWVQQGGQVAVIGASDALFVKVPVGETLLQFIQPGAEVEVVINAFAQSLTGTIDTIDPRADTKTKNVSIKIRIPVIAKSVENLSATVHLPISNKQQLSIIPRDALIKFKGKDFVYTVKEGKAGILPVNIVTFLGDKVAADNPYLAPGMPVVIEGNERLRPDQPVTIIGE
ncbi:efflux RND transporter periplasmic adaptor subunit [Desulfogranum marinum]|uniref:efflux RND transporter periplasmic adaptor subunit n=1 Tax=Desulfogranum marinum TaxID=453220 RepID=UPI0029C8477B|nr:efflux RND transporter periplasmic adaptor subunit [Desulfogranum marinum]